MFEEIPEQVAIGTELGLYGSLSSDQSSNPLDEKSPIAEQPPVKTGAMEVAALTPIATPSPPPDGGVLAWMQVVGSFFLFMNSWGIVNTFGVYQTFYENDFLSHQAPSNISWVGSVQAFLLVIVSTSIGPLFDLGYFTSLLVLGSLFIILGMMMTSLCYEYWQVMLAQGLLVGLGCGFLFVPSVAIVATYFTSKKALATGIAISGSSIGGVIYSTIFSQLQPKIGFDWATRVIGFIVLASLALSIAVMRVRVQPETVRRMLDLGAFRELSYTIFNIAVLFGFIGLYIPFFYIQSYAIEKGLDPKMAFDLVSVLNAASFFGRIIPNYIADKAGLLNILVPCTLIAAIWAYAWLAIDQTGGIMALCVFYGFFSGSFVSLSPTAVVGFSPNLSVVGARMGVTFAFAGGGILIGNPVAGAILARHGWVGVKAFCATSVMAAGILMAIARVAKTAKLMDKA